MEQVIFERAGGTLALADGRATAELAIAGDVPTLLARLGVMKPLVVSGGGLARSGVEDAVGARELARAIERFLDTLSAENRVIFVRRHYFGDSCKAIARLTGLTEKNVSVRLSRTRAKLKQYLTESGVTEWN